LRLLLDLFCFKEGRNNHSTLEAVRQVFAPNHRRRASSQQLRISLVLLFAESWPIFLQGWASQRRINNSLNDLLKRVGDASQIDFRQQAMLQA